MYTMQTFRFHGRANGSISSRCVFTAVTLLMFAVGICAQIAPAVVSLSSSSGSQGWILDGPEFLARAGAAMNGDCDLNGDGFTDLLIGATGAGPSDQGMAFVVFGSASGTAPPVSLNSAGLRMTGELSGDAAGASVACAGDVDADGFDDVLIGAPFADSPGLLNTGAAYLVYGGEMLPATLSLATSGMRINGVVGNQKVGAVLAGGADINGDGYADMVVTAPNFKIGRASCRERVCSTV